MITSQTKICLSVGDPIKHSLGPLIYNAIYPQLGLDGQYVYVSAQVKAADLENFVLGAKAMDIRGITCTMPHKSAVMAYVDEVDEVAHKIGAVNTVVNDNGKLTGYNTDWLGIVKPLEKLTSIRGKQVVILGTGGAARAAAYAVANSGGNLSIWGRKPEKAVQIATDFGGSSKELDDINFDSVDIVINATSVGMGSAADESPLPKPLLNARQIVFDVVPSPARTKLLAEAQVVGAQTISGREMFLFQGMEQFKLFTGVELPEEIMRKALDNVAKD